MYEQWLKMERFNYYQLPFLIILLAVLAFVFLATLLHLRNRRVRNISIVLLVAMIAIGGYTTYQYRQYRELISQSASLTASVRTLEPHYGYYRNIRNSEIYEYRSLYQPYLFEQLAFYDEHRLEEPIEYLGKLDNKYYFKYQGESFYAREKFITIVDGGNEAKRIGVNFTLNDRQFTETGFLEKSIDYLVGYEIPKSMVEQTISEDEAKNITPLRGTFAGWLIP